MSNLKKCNFLLILLLFFFRNTALFAQADQPNILFILADDLGWSDLSNYGNPIIQTPNIDQLANEGMKFTNAYADPVCAPTRASIQIGQYSARVKMTGVQNGHRRPYAKLVPPPIHWSLGLDYTTIAEALQQAGYVSTIIGKWHLNYDNTRRPVDQGYVMPDNKPFTGRYAQALEKWCENNPHKNTGSITKRCVQFIEQNKDKPFFCIASYTAVHTVPEARQELIDKYKKIVAQNRTTIDPVYAAMCEVLDEAVGHFKNVLKEQGLDKNTLIIFYSDNGGVVEERGFLFDGYPNLVTHNWPLRDEKGTLYEGGIRVPLIVHWPGKIETGSVNTNVMHCIDIFPTMLDIAGANKPEDQVVDGVSLLPMMLDKKVKEDRDLYWHYPHYHHSTPASAIRSGDYKLIYFFENESYELYNLKNDIGEQYNLVKAEPEKAQQLLDKLKNWLSQEVNADLPRINPFYDPKRQLIWGERMDNALKKEGIGFGIEHLNP